MSGNKYRNTIQQIIGKYKQTVKIKLQENGKTIRVYTLNFLYIFVNKHKNTKVGQENIVNNEQGQRNVTIELYKL